MLYETENEVGSYKRTVDPVLLPVTPAELRDETDLCNDTSQDARLARYAAEAVEQIESDARIIIMTQTWQLYQDRFPCGYLELRRCPVQSLTFIKHITDNTLTTWSSSNYQTDLVSKPARVLPIVGACWPNTDCGAVNAVQVEFVAGYATQAAVPKLIKSAVLSVVRGKYWGCDLGDAYWTIINRLRPYGWAT